jgi:hypothetical protein
MEEREADYKEAIQKIWHRIKTYFYAEWFKRCGRVQRGQMAMANAKRQFAKDFGSDRQMSYFDQDRLVVSRLAP